MADVRVTAPIGHRRHGRLGDARYGRAQAQRARHPPSAPGRRPRQRHAAPRLRHGLPDGAAARPRRAPCRIVDSRQDLGPDRKDPCAGPRDLAAGPLHHPRRRQGRGISRRIEGNGLPVQTPTGRFPISHMPTPPTGSTPTRTPSRRNESCSPCRPIRRSRSEPSCVPMGMIGVALNGVAIFNALDDGGARRRRARSAGPVRRPSADARRISLSRAEPLPARRERRTKS